MTLAIDTILKGTGFGPMQSVGPMQVIPVLGDDDATFAPPELEAGTQGYGNVVLRNAHDRPTIVPPGAGWVVTQKAQDHAVAGGAFLKAFEQKTVTTAMCIQQTQGGMIARAKHALTILPARLRAKALAVRHVVDFRKLWSAIEELNRSFGVTAAGGNLVAFVREYAKQLDELVAEFEIVPRQIGAIVLVDGEVVGVERAPSAEYFRVIWDPLVRVCYGSLAVASAKAGHGPPRTRRALVVAERTLAGLREALSDVTAREAQIADEIVAWVRGVALAQADHDDDTLDLRDGKGSKARLRTVAGNWFAGQIVTTTAGDAERVAFASLVAQR